MVCLHCKAPVCFCVYYLYFVFKTIFFCFGKNNGIWLNIKLWAMKHIKLCVYDLTLDTGIYMKIWNIMMNSSFKSIDFLSFAQDGYRITFVELITVLFLLIFDLFPFLFSLYSNRYTCAMVKRPFDNSVFMRLILFRYCEILLKGPKRQSMNWLLF